MHKLNEQEVFWQNDFGNDYSERARGADRVAANLAFFSKSLAHTRGIASILEFGSNIGLNMISLKQLLPHAALAAIEINRKAALELEQNIPGIEVHNISILDFKPDKAWDLVLSKGVLIHIHPDDLPKAYELMYNSSSRYLLICEYYNPTPINMEYRGHTGKLFKRDFAGELLDRYADLTLLDYGFSYRRDPNFPQDDLTWFLLEKISISCNR